jgi:hypothetical protein
MLNRRVHLVNITLVSCAVLLLLCLFEATTETNDILTGYAFLAALALTVVLALLHLQRALFQAGQRLKHLTFAGLIALIVLGLFPMCAKRHLSVLRRAFLEKRVRLYDAMAAKILENRAKLTDRNADVGKLVQRRGVMARTNKDGSVSIRFHGYVNGGRFDYSRSVGYLYHSGPVLPKPGDTNYYLFPEETALSFPRYHFHLTNDWYEY